MRMKFHQKINHFPGMMKICRKMSLAQLVRLWNEDCEDSPDYINLPVTFLLPGELDKLVPWCKDNPDSTLIIKPDSGAQGKGIFLWNASHGPLRRQDLHRKCVAQEYIPS